MPRTPEEIRSEMEAAKAAGEDGRSGRMRSLKAELKEAEAALDGSDGTDDVEAPDTWSIYPPAVSVPDGANVYASDEWRFVEKALAELEPEIGKGTYVGAAKKLYNVLDAKVKIWRVARDVMKRVGVGKRWPQWTALGLDDTTGEPLPPRPVPPPAAVPQAPKVSEAGMPVRPAAPSPADILAHVTGGDPRAAVKEQIASRAEPARVGA